MKRFILLFCLAGLISSARATITPITDTSTNLTLDFSLEDNFITPQGVTTGSFVLEGWSVKSGEAAATHRGERAR